MAPGSYCGKGPGGAYDPQSNVPMPLPEDLDGEVPVFDDAEFCSSWEQLIATETEGGAGPPEARALLKDLVEDNFHFVDFLDPAHCAAFEAVSRVLEEINVAMRALEDPPRPPDTALRRARHVDPYEEDLREQMPAEFRLIDGVRERLRREGCDAKMPMNINTYYPAPLSEENSIWSIAPHIDGPTTTPGGRETSTRGPENRLCLEVGGEGVLVVGLMVVASNGFALRPRVLAYVTVKLAPRDGYRLTEVMAGRVTVAARKRGMAMDAIRVVHGVFAVDSRRVLVNITSRV